MSSSRMVESSSVVSDDLIDSLVEKCTSIGEDEQQILDEIVSSNKIPLYSVLKETEREDAKSIIDILEADIKLGFDNSEKWKGLTFADAALTVMREPDAFKKNMLTYEAFGAFKKGYLLYDHPGFDKSSVPLVPARPAYVQEIDPRKLQNSKLKASVHAIVHAESYAVDLSWDIILRFGYSPELWGVRLPQSPVSIIEPNSKESYVYRRLPRQFFDEWIRVAFEEATHMSKWALIMKEKLNVSYGDLPSHNGLWESAMRTRTSLASRLAVVHCVHEARGLDTAELFRNRLAKNNDKASVAILDVNQREEEGHVRYGVRWLRFLASLGAVPIENYKKYDTSHEVGFNLSPAVGESEEVDSKIDSKDPSEVGYCYTPVSDIFFTENELSSGVVSKMSPDQFFTFLVPFAFCGKLKPPFAAAKRARAGMSPQWYTPLSESSVLNSVPDSLIVF